MYCDVEPVNLIARLGKPGLRVHLKAMPVPTRAGDSAKWSKSQEAKGLARQIETLSALRLDVKPGVGLP